MQFAKDTFYMALRERLAALNPERTVAPEGISQPAILVAENEAENAQPDFADCFYLRFKSASIAQGFESSSRPLMTLECTFSYRTAGTVEGGSDRGRTLGTLDAELLAICEPASVPKLDYTQANPASLSTRVFWARPQLGEVTASAGELARTASATIFFYPEVTA